jgi:hypothetical protein
LRAIKRYCHEYCQAGAGRAETVNCQGDKSLDGGRGCPVFLFRLGTNPNISAETREKRRREAARRVAEGMFGFPKETHHGTFNGVLCKKLPHRPATRRDQLQAKIRLKKACGLLPSEEGAA